MTIDQLKQDLNERLEALISDQVQHRVRQILLDSLPTTGARRGRPPGGKNKPKLDPAKTPSIPIRVAVRSRGPGSIQKIIGSRARWTTSEFAGQVGVPLTHASVYLGRAVKAGRLVRVRRGLYQRKT